MFRQIFLICNQSHRIRINQQLLITIPKRFLSTENHVLIVLHGAGDQSNDSMVSLSFENCIKSMQVNLSEVTNPITSEQRKQTKIWIEPVEWHSKLRESWDFNDILEKVTLPSIQAIRDFTNGHLLDCALYLTDVHRKRVVSEVIQSLNDIRKKYSSNDGIPLKISVFGHSLGGIIAWDVVSDLSSLTECEIENLFIIGSPVGMMLAIRQNNITRPQNVKHIFNVFHPLDPLAYRMEPLFSPSNSSKPPVLIKRGDKEIKNMGDELREKVNQYIDLLDVTKLSTFQRFFSSSSSSTSSSSSSSSSNLSSSAPSIQDDEKNKVNVTSKLWLEEEIKEQLKKQAYILSFGNRAQSNLKNMLSRLSRLQSTPPLPQKIERDDVGLNNNNKNSNSNNNNDIHDEMYDLEHQHKRHLEASNHHILKEEKEFWFDYWDKAKLKNENSPLVDDPRELVWRGVSEIITFDQDLKSSLEYEKLMEEKEKEIEYGKSPSIFGDEQISHIINTSELIEEKPNLHIQKEKEIVLEKIKRENKQQEQQLEQEEEEEKKKKKEDDDDIEIEIVTEDLFKQQQIEDMGKKFKNLKETYDDDTRYDYVLDTPSSFYNAGDYVTCIRAHFAYWSDKALLRFVFHKIQESSLK